MTQPGYNDNVFINCPFDEEYMPMLHAMVYTIYRSGFYPQCALAEDDGSDMRLEKIYRCIEKSRYGIHDLSRTELNAAGLPRFNMPLELGIFLGAKKFGTGRQHRNRNIVIFEKTKFQYQKYISDLNGVDTKAHNNNPEIFIGKIRDWLRTSSGRNTIPGTQLLKTEYAEFMSNLPTVVAKLNLDADNILFNDYCSIVESVIEEKLKSA